MTLIRPLNARRGFTFLEIMFVVVIIGVLLAIAVPKLTGKSQDARKKATEAQIRNVGVALKMYEMHVGGFPTSSQGLEALLEKPNDVDEEMWEGPYLEESPVDAWKKPLNYASPGDHNKDYDLWSNGPDGKEGTPDDIKNWKEK